MAHSDHKAVLHRISASNPPHAVGPGLDPQQLVPAFTISNRAVAEMLQRCLLESDIRVQTRRSRLLTEFFVAANQLQKSLEIRHEFLVSNPDTKLQKFSRDYDGVFLLTPLTVIAAAVAFYFPFLPKYAWLAVLVSGATAMFVWERINRLSRHHLGQQWTLRELLWLTAIVAANAALWQLALTINGR